MVKSLELTSNELYFVLHYMEKLNKQINNKYSNSVFKKVEKLFLESLEEDNTNDFRREYETEWIRQ